MTDRRHVMRRKRVEEMMEWYARRNMLYRQHPNSGRYDCHRPDYMRWVKWRAEWIATCKRVINEG